MYSNILNNWFYGEDVQVDDMKLLTKSFLQLCFAANGGNVMATGLTPTITGNNIATTKGFVYFGETSDAIFIERTGTNQLISFVDPTSVPLIANGYLYVKPIITYDVNNRTSTVSGVVYTSTNAADEGINLATITNSVITQVNSINPLGATQLQRGITQLATQAEVNAGTATNKAVAPSTFAASTQLASKASLAANNTFTGVNTFNNRVHLSYGNGSPSGITVFSNPGSQGSTCYIGSDNAGAGGYNGIVFGANQSRPWLNNLGTTNNNSTAIATLSDVTANGGGIVASGSNANGSWVKYANGLIQQWGNIISGGGGGYITFPVIFPISYQCFTTSTGNEIVALSAPTTVNIYFTRSTNGGASGSGSSAFVWTAIGY